MVTEPFISLHVHGRSDVVLKVDGDVEVLLSVSWLPSADHHHGHQLLLEHKFPLLHDVRLRRLGPDQSASNALRGHGGRVLVARVVRTVHDAHERLSFWRSSCS